MRPKGKRDLNKDEIAAIQARIGTETAYDLAECFDVHVFTIWKWTRGMKRARRRYSRSVISDKALLAMVEGHSQAEVARQVGITPAAVCIRLKKIRQRGVRTYDELEVREGPRSGGRRGPSRRACDPNQRGGRTEAGSRRAEA